MKKTNSPLSPPALPRGLQDRFGYLLNRPAIVFRERAAEALQPLGMITPHMGVLSVLRGDGPLTQKELGRHLKVDPTTMVWLIDALEKKGVVRREVHPNDRRAHLVKLTPAGETLFQRARKRLEKLESDFLSSLTPAEQGELKRLLTKLFKNVQTQSIPKDMLKGPHA